MSAPPLRAFMAPAQMRSTDTDAPAKMAIQEAGAKMVGEYLDMWAHIPKLKLPLCIE